jgi:hypothetical protein
VNIHRHLLVSLFFAIGQSASAATVAFSDLDSLTPKGTFSVATGESFAIDIIGVDFENLLGGTFSIQYDESLLELNSVSVDDYWDFAPASGSDAGEDLWGVVGFNVFANLPGSGDFRIATISFTARDALGESPIAIVDSEFFADNSPEEPQVITPTLAGAAVSVVPLPGTLWFILSAFGAVAVRAMRRVRGSPCDAAA